MPANYDDKSPYANVLQLGGTDGFSWLPPKDRERANAYAKYDQFYWNDDLQYGLRYLAEEVPNYVPNPRTVVDTTAHYYLKGLQVMPKKAKTGNLADRLSDFLKREMFYSRFHKAKHAGVARGDYVFHMTADNSKPGGKRISLTAIHPSKVILDTDPDDVSRVTQVHLVECIPHPDPNEAKSGKKAIKELRYWYSDPTKDEDEISVDVNEVGRGYPDGEEGHRVVMRVEQIWSDEYNWWDPEERDLIQVTLPEEALPDPIDTIPVYWFSNLGWDDSPYGYSELRGFERLMQSISQVTTDQGTSLSLEGLGVYVTDGGKPVDNNGNDTFWEISPGKVLEVPTGAYLRRVEGVGSVKPNMDHIDYLESKIREAGGLSDVALGRVDVQTAESGIAMAIKFMPTLAKLDERDKAGVDRATQMFYDWKNWWQAYEDEVLTGDIEVNIGDKLPTDRTGRINELNNMLDRGVISKQYYRDEMQNLGYEFPDDLEDQIDEEAQKEAEQKAAAAPPGLQQNAIDASTGDMPPPPNPNQPGQVTEKKQVFNNSNNKSRPNESAGTEAKQSIAKQARGGKPVVAKRVAVAKK